MTPTLCVLLCLGLCLNQRIRAQEVRLSRPSLRADKGPLVPLRSNVTLRCQGSQGTEQCLLEKEQETATRKILEVKPCRGEAEFPIPTVTAKHAGKYYCRSRRSSVSSEHSKPLELVVTGLHEPPSLSAWPSSQVTSGQQVTLQCHSKRWYGRFALYKDGTEMEKRGAQSQGRGAQANFSILAGTPGETYRCYSFNSNMPYAWSDPSDPLMLNVSASDNSKDSHLPPNPGDPQILTSSTPTTSPTPESGHSRFGILIGISTFLILLLLFLLLLWHRHRQRQTRLGNGDREAEAKKTPRSSDPAGTPLKETVYAVVSKDRQTEEARPEDPAASPGKELQEVTYAQLNLHNLKVVVEDPPTSGSEDPTVYAALR